MGETLIRWPVCAAALVAALSFAACSRSAPVEAPPAPVAEESAPPPLAGGPPAQTGPGPTLAEAALAAGDTTLASPAASVPAEPQRYAEGYGRAHGQGYDHRARDRRYLERERALAREREDARQLWLRRHRERH